MAGPACARRHVPAIAPLKNGNYVVVAGVKQGDSGASAAVMDPLAKPANSIFLVPQAAFVESWSGELVLLKREYALLDENQPFGLRWFLPELVRQKGLLRDVAIAALTLHLLALAVPIFIQLVIDKVIVHRSYSTLYVLAFGVMFALAFEAVFSFLRQYLCSTPPTRDSGCAEDLRAPAAVRTLFDTASPAHRAPMQR